MDWESYRTDIEAIKLAVNECERLGVDKEELLIISIYRLYEFYKTEDDRVYLLGALLHLKAYLELGMEYEKNRKIFCFFEQQLQHNPLHLLPCAINDP